MKFFSSIKTRFGFELRNYFLPLSRQACLVLLILVNLQSASSLASVVVETTVKEMMDASELVFEGQVIDVVSKLDTGGHQIHTFVTFRISDVIKGNYSQSKIELSFLGGSAAGLTLETSDMHLPGFGEKGIYFVETLQRRQVHPFYGWGQGHFVIKTDGEGVQRVRTHNQFRVIGIGSGGPRRIQLSRDGVAKGVIISEDPRDKGISVSEFKTRLRDISRGQP